MKYTKRILSVLLAFVIVCTMCLANSSLIVQAAANNPTSITLSNKKASMSVGETMTLKVKSITSAKVSKIVTWKTSNEKIATVSSKGKVKAKRNGTVTITVQSKSNPKVTAKCKIKIYKATKKLNLTSSKTYSLIVGKQQKLSAKVTNPKKGAAPITWSTKNNKVAKVNKNGIVTAVSKGTTDIIGKSGKKKVTVRIVVEGSGTSNTPTAAMEDVPKFLGFKNYAGEEIQTKEKSEDMRTYFAMSAQQEIMTPETPKNESEKVENNQINKGEMLLLKLSYENKKRDNILEIVLNDSDYGKKQIYTANASVNKIVSSDTFYDEEKDSYVTDLLLQMPETKGDTERIIEVEETCFLRETVGLQGYVDLSKARQTSVRFVIPENPIPSYPVYFKFVENKDGTYMLTSVNSQYTLPDILYIPPSYQGKAVTVIADEAFEGALMKELIVPESIVKIGRNMTGSGAGALRLEKIIMLGEAPKLGTLSLNREQLDGGCQIVIKEEYLSSYHNDDPAYNAWETYTSLFSIQK